MGKKKKEEAAGQSCPSAEGKPDEDAQYEAFKRKNEEAKLLLKTFKGITNIIVVMSGKGGVGKSTVATNLAAAFASKGNKVGILDADVTGPDIPKMLGLEGQKAKVSETAEPKGEMLAPLVGPLGIKVISSSFLLQSSDQAVVWRGPMKMGLIKEFSRLQEPLPVVMDDIFVNFDPQRARAAVETVMELAGDHQILLFSCHPETCKLIRDVNPNATLFLLQDGRLRVEHRRRRQTPPALSAGAEPAPAPTE